MAAFVKVNLAGLVVVAALFFARPALGDEVAPALEGADLRVRADAVLKALVGARPDAKLRGLYAAFDPSISDPKALAACDDDGDYVIVLSDAMLRLVSFLASTDKPDEYADFLAKNQIRGKRLLPPPSGVSVESDARWRDIIAFLYARELAHLRARDLVCENPTTTKERGDDEWTVAEQATALATARTLYPGKQLERDEAAMTELRAVGGSTPTFTDAGARQLMHFYARFEAANAVTPAQAMPTYLALHPRSAWRAAALERHGS